jgi:hypothetical protein
MSPKPSLLEGHRSAQTSVYGRLRQHKTSGSVECWFNDDNGKASPPSGTFESVRADQHHTCGVTTSGTVECWGNDGYGQSSPPEL